MMGLLSTRSTTFRDIEAHVSHQDGERITEDVLELKLGPQTNQGRTEGPAGSHIELHSLSKGDSLARERLDEDLHTTAETEDCDGGPTPCGYCSRRGYGHSQAACWAGPSAPRPPAPLLQPSPSIALCQHMYVNRVLHDSLQLSPRLGSRHRQKQSRWWRGRTRGWRARARA